MLGHSREFRAYVLDGITDLADDSGEGQAG
jgi:hypothetical protein